MQRLRRLQRKALEPGKSAGCATALALTGIKLLISVFPGLLYASCALALIFYPLDDATCETMKRDLEARREEEESEPAS